MPLTLTWLAATRLPVEAEALRPDRLAGWTAAAVARLALPVGNTTAEAGELFRVEGRGDPGDPLVLRGDMPGVRRIGQEMTDGLLIVEGNVGDHLAAGLRGGVVEVRGNAAHRAGTGLRGGLLRIHGSAGDHLGSARTGDRAGLRDGTILVHGSIGAEAGGTMRRGLIAVRGAAGDGLGRDLIAGSILAFGPVGRQAGSGMKRGTLALFDRSEPRLPPTFRPSCDYRPPFLTVYLRQLAAWGFPLPPIDPGASFRRYNGDLIGLGKGEVLWMVDGP